jgi:CBS domain-containing protein
MHVADVMTRDPVFVHPNETLKHVAAVLADRRISGVPVMRQGELVGVVSEGDILFKEGGPLSRRTVFERLLDPHAVAEAGKLAARTAGEAMTAPAVTVAPWQSVAAAARLMLDAKVKRLPVVEDGRLVGIVTRADLVRAFARSDDAIVREIQEEVIHGSAGLGSPESIALSVDEGAVTLAGFVDGAVDADVIAELVGKVPGVVSVDADALTWRHADELRDSPQMP